MPSHGVSSQGSNVRTTSRAARGTGRFASHVAEPAHTVCAAAGGVASGPEEGSGGSSTRGVAGKGAETQPDKKETGAEPDPK